MTASSKRPRFYRTDMWRNASKSEGDCRGDGLGYIWHNILYHGLKCLRPGQLRNDLADPPNDLWCPECELASRRRGLQLVKLLRGAFVEAGLKVSHPRFISEVPGYITCY